MDSATTLIGRAIRALGTKKVVRLWGYSYEYVCRMARDSGDPEHPDFSGKDSDPRTKYRDLLEAVAAHPQHRALLKEFRVSDEAFYARLLDNDEPDPITDCKVLALAGDAGVESSQGVAASIRAAMASDDPVVWREALVQVTEDEAATHRLALALARRLDAMEAGISLSSRRSA